MNAIIEDFDTIEYARTSENNMPSMGTVVALTPEEQAEAEVALRLS
jgi:hypothetical protein